MTVGLKVNKCLQCGHKWLPRVPEPKACPECRSRRWNEREEA